MPLDKMDITLLFVICTLFSWVLLFPSLSIMHVVRLQECRTANQICLLIYRQQQCHSFLLSFYWNVPDSLYIHANVEREKNAAIVIHIHERRRSQSQSQMSKTKPTTKHTHTHSIKQNDTFKVVSSSTFYYSHVYIYIVLILYFGLTLMILHRRTSSVHIKTFYVSISAV